MAFLYRLLPKKRIPILLQLSVTLHLSWAALLWFEPSLAQITALYMLTQSCLALSVLLAGSALLTLVPFYHRHFTKYQVLACLAPQQILLYYAALGAMLAAYNGSYGDGVIHPHFFIFGDQWSIALRAYFHTVMILRIGDRL